MSTTYIEDLENEVRLRFENLVAGVVNPKLITFYDNMEVDPEYPDDRWARVRVATGASRQVSLGGNKRVRTPGVLLVQLFWQLGVGTKDINELADLVRNSFVGITVGTVVYEMPYGQIIGRSKTWWQVNVNCPFYSDDILGD